MIEISPFSDWLAEPGTAANKTSGETKGLFQSLLLGETTSGLDSIFAKMSRRYGVPENLLKAVAKAESNFDKDAVSSCGAMGIMQLMPSTASSLGVQDAFDPEQNIMGGAKLLSQLLSQYGGDTKLALAAYNAGGGNVDKYGGVPPFAETQNYVNRVLGYLQGEVDVPGTDSSFSGNDFTYTDYRKFTEIFLSLYLAAQDSSQSLAGAGMYYLGL